MQYKLSRVSGEKWNEFKNFSSARRESRPIQRYNYSEAREKKTEKQQNDI